MNEVLRFAALAENHIDKSKFIFPLANERLDYIDSLLVLGLEWQNVMIHTVLKQLETVTTGSLCQSEHSKIKTRGINK